MLWLLYKGKLRRKYVGLAPYTDSGVYLSNTDCTLREWWCYLKRIDRLRIWPACCHRTHTRHNHMCVCNFTATGTRVYVCMQYIGIVELKTPMYIRAYIDDGSCVLNERQRGRQRAHTRDRECNAIAPEMALLTDSIHCYEQLFFSSFLMKFVRNQVYKFFMIQT